MTRGSIQFAKSFDGTPIAYWSIGSGPPIILIHNFTASHTELDWEVGSFRSFYRSLAERHEVIRLDPRGAGLSAVDPDPTENQVAGDVEAVANAMGLDRFDLLAASTMAPIGVRLATTERIGHLILCDPSVVQAEATEQQRFIRATQALAEAGTGELSSAFWTSIAPPEDAGALTAVVGANARQHPGVMSGVAWDARALLADVVAPTLIVYTRDGPVTSLAQAREAAATIPQARLVGVDGSLAPYLVDREQMLEAVGEFLGWAPSRTQSGSTTSVIVFTDVVASTEVVDRLGDESARAAIRSVEELITTTAAELSGKVIKHLGDGSLLEFQSASSALEFARAVQGELASGDVALRIGMAAGEPIREEGDLHGAVVVVASRVSGAASAGDVLVSDGVKHLVVGKQFEFEDLGEITLKGFDKPVGIWRLRL